MKLELARILNEMNSSFYQKVADSFSATRQSPWDGWQCVAKKLTELEIVDNISVLDLACGNLRFEEFLAGKFPESTFDFYCYDNCVELLPQETPSVSHLYSLDISEALLEDSLEQKLNQPACDLSVAFGFMHHLSSKETRLALLEALVANTKPGGLIAVSFWQFMNHENMAKKARLTTEQALKENPELKSYFGSCDANADSEELDEPSRSESNKTSCPELAKASYSKSNETNNPEWDKASYPELDENDYFLGWKDTQGIYRYCHHFTQEELDWLADSVAKDAQLVDAFQADGRNGRLNSYLIFKKN